MGLWSRGCSRHTGKVQRDDTVAGTRIRSVSETSNRRIAMHVQDVENDGKSSDRGIHQLNCEEVGNES